MAFKLRAPFLNKPDKSSYANLDTETPDLTSSLSVNDVNADGVDNTEVEEEEKDSAIDQFINENENEEGSGERRDNEFLQQRIDKARNPRQEAKLKLRLARREKRQEESAKRKYAKGNMQLGLDEGVLDFDELSPEDQAKYKDPKAEEKPAGLDEKIKKGENDLSTTDEVITNDNGTFIRSTDKDGVVTKFEKQDKGAVGQLNVNRGGRGSNSNMLLMSPVLKSHKQSHKGAVGMMKMQSIAQDPGALNMNAGFEALPAGVQDKILKNSPSNYSPLANEDETPTEKAVKSDETNIEKKVNFSDNKIVPEEKINKTLDSLKQDKILKYRPIAKSIPGPNLV